MVMTFVIEGVPIPFRAPFVTSRGAFNPRWAEMKIMKEIVRSQYKDIPSEKAVICHLAFYVPIPKATSRKRRLLMLSGKIRPITRGDRTNYAKLYEDVIQGIVIVDDAQIVGGDVAKWYDEKPRTVITIEELL